MRWRWGKVGEAGKITALTHAELLIAFKCIPDWRIAEGLHQLL